MGAFLCSEDTQRHAADVYYLTVVAQAYIFYRLSRNRMFYELET
jgi:hypothetical protein